MDNHHEHKHHASEEERLPKDEKAMHDHHQGTGNSTHEDHAPDMTPQEHAEKAMEKQPEHAHRAGHGAKTAMLMDEAEHAAEHTAQNHQSVPQTGHAMAMDHSAHTGNKAQAHDEHAGHGAHADHTGHEQMFRRRFWVSLVLSIPVVLYSQGLQMMTGIMVPAFPGSQWLAPLFSVIVFLYGGLPFLQMAVPELKNRQPGMMTLISLAISVAFLYSVATLFLPNQMDFFWELVTLIDIMLLGHWIEMRSVRQASGALNALAKLMPDTADRIGPNGQVQTVAVSDLRQNDLVLVRPGTSIPADGEVAEGESSVNEAMITGESKPVSKHPSDKVIGGSINGDGSLRVRVTATGEQTALAGIMQIGRAHV